MKTTMTALGAALAVAACGAPSGQRPPVQVAPPQVQANELTIDTLPGGQFRGRAGAAWTRDEVAAQGSSMECGNRKPAAIDIRPLEGGGHSFTGRC